MLGDPEWSLCGGHLTQPTGCFWPAADCHSEDKMRTARPRLVPQPRSGCAQSAGQDGPLLYPGPLCGGVSGTIGRVAGVDRATAWMPELSRRRSGCPMSAPFSHGQESDRKARPRLTDLPGMDAQQAPSGVAFLFGYLSLWPHKEKVTRAPQECESCCF
jgi:hypothetical protein